MIDRGVASEPVLAGASWVSPTSLASTTTPILERFGVAIPIDVVTIGAFCVGAVVFLSTAAVIARRFEGPGIPALAACGAGLGVTMFVGALLLLAGAPLQEEGPGLNLLTALIWAGSVPWLLFALQYTGRGKALAPTRAAALAIPALAYLFTLVFRIVVDPAEATVLDWVSLALVNVLALSLAGMYLLGSGFVVQTSYRQGNVSLLASLGFGAIGLLLAMTPLLSFLGFAYGLVWSYLILALVSPVAGLLLAGIVCCTESLDSTAVAAGTAARERAFLDLADTAFVLDDRERIVELNDTATETFGLDRGAVLGRPFAEIVDLPPEVVRTTEPDAGEPPTSAPATGADTGVGPPDPVGTDGGLEALSGPNRMVSLDTAAGTRQFDVRVSTLSDAQDRRIGSVVSFRDVTDRELREQRIAIFNRVLRHNLRNKLSIVQSATDVLRSESDEHDRLVTAIDSATEDLLSVGRQAREIEQLLDERAGQRRSIPLERLLESAVSDARASHPEVTISPAFDPAAADTAVPEVLTFAVEELLDNAAKHNDAADPRIEITAARSDESVTITVTDNGPGIPEQERIAIRADDESPLEHASGLGLWSVRWAVTAVGGEVAISEADGGGAAVELSVPAE